MNKLATLSLVVLILLVPRGLGEGSDESATITDEISNLPNRLKPINLGFDLSPFAARDTVRWQVKGQVIPQLKLPFLYHGKVSSEAEVKFGRLYLDFTRWTTSWLWSDNVNQTQFDRERDQTASMALASDLYFEVGENSYLWTSGSLVWLPLEGKVGVDGFGIRDIYSLGLQELFRSDLALSGRIAGWDVLLRDELTTRDRRWETELSGKLSIYEGEDFGEQDVAGTYEFGDDDIGNTYFESRYNNLTRERGVEVRNDLSLTFSRELIHHATAQITPYHRRYWYIDDPNEGSPNIVEREYGVNASWIFRRPDWRFNPFLLYNQEQNDVDEGWLWTARAGAEGPLTDQIRIYTDAGIGRAGAMGYDTTGLWRFGLIHIAGPLTRHQVIWERRFRGHARSLETRGAYYLDQILGPRLRLRFLLEVIDADSRYYDLFYLTVRRGLRLFWQVANRIAFGQAVVYSDTNWQNDLYTDIVYYESLMTVVFSASSYLELKYIHRDQEATPGFRETFRENVVSLSYVVLF